MAFEFELPDVGEGVAEGEIVGWLVETGDTVTEDQPVVEVETDKAVVEVPSPVNGTVVQRHAEAVADDVDVEVLDLRTLSPLDFDSIRASFEKTGRALVVQEAPRTGGLGSEIVATLQEESLLYQEAPIEQIAGFDTPFPLYALEDYYLPEAARIADGIRETYEF